MRGSGAFRKPVKPVRQGTVEVSEVRMLTCVSIKGVKSTLAVSPRFPAQRSSAQGESAPKEDVTGLKP